MALALVSGQSGDTGGTMLNNSSPGTILPGNTTIGNCVVVCIATSMVWSTCSISSSIGTFVNITPSARGGNSYALSWFVCYKATGAAAAITPTFNAAYHWYGQGTEWSGAGTTALTGSSATGSSGVPSLGVTPHASGDAVFVAACSYNAALTGPSSPWTLYSAGGFTGSAACYAQTAWQVAPSGSQLTASWSSISVAWVTSGMDLEVAAAAAAYAPPTSYAHYGQAVQRASTWFKRVPWHEKPSGFLVPSGAERRLVVAGG